MIIIIIIIIIKAIENCLGAGRKTVVEMKILRGIFGQDSPSSQQFFLLQ